MKKIISILFIAVLVTACGGGGSAAASPAANPSSGSVPNGDISGQVDPVQST